MKKLLAGILLFITACSAPTATSTPMPESTLTVPPRTPTIAATATETPVPTATLTATPVPMYFSEEFDSDLSAWTSFITNGESAPESLLQNSLLRLNFSMPNTWYYAVHDAHTYSTVRVDASFDSTDPNSASLGLICMYSETNGWFEYTFSSGGTYNVLLGQWLSDGIARYTPIVYESTEYLSPGRTNYEIGITCDEEILSLYINGKLFRNLDVSRFGLKEGKVGIAAAIFDNVPATAYFDWFRVSEPVK